MVKLKDIARETGLTISTVSKALNNSREISEATTAKVLATAEALGYRIKRTETRQKIKTIGVILPEVRSHLYAELLHTLTKEADRRGYMLMTVLTRDFSEDLFLYIERLLSYQLAGLFINGTAGLSPMAQKLLRDNNVPSVVIRNCDQDECYGIDSIYINDEIGICQAVDYLIELGHTKIGYLGENLSWMRCEALCNALKQRGLPVNPSFIKQGKERFEEGGYLRALELLEEPELPTAVLTSYDQVAYGATCAFLEKGLRIPEDISVVGFDSVSQCAHYPVPLTSISNPVGQMGVVAVKLLVDAITSPLTHVVQNVAIQGRLVIRSSTCPPKTKL